MVARTLVIRRWLSDEPVPAEPATRKAGQLAATERLSREAMWGAAMDLGEWLKGLGLGQYEATFRAHEIDADVLPDLTEADLEKIGLPLGA